MKGACNIRDLGGYSTIYSTRIKPALIYRSDDLNSLTENDLRLMAEMQLKTVIDFRSHEEIARAPDCLPESVKKCYSLNISLGNINNFEKMSYTESTNYMLKIYSSIPSSAAKQYAEFFRILMHGGSAPLLFHCSAGKDRTGFAAALFLSALGVSKDEIYADYLLSAEKVKHKYAQYLQRHPASEPLFTVKAEYLDATFDTIRKKYGNVKNYLQQHLNIDLELLRTMYTEKH